MRRLGWFLLSLLGAIASAPAWQQDPAPPAWLKPHIATGSLSYSDLGWARPRWAADTRGRSEWHSALDWVAAVKTARAAAIAEGLRGGGVAAVTLVAGCYDNEACHQIDDLEQNAASFSSWDVLNGAAKEARPFIEGYRYAIETTAHVQAANAKATLHDKLLAALVLDQTNMIALTGFRYPERRLPAMSPPALAVFNLALNHRARVQFRANAEMLKAVIAEQGWPRRSQIGDSAENAAWILVQHADDEPIFQYEALRLIDARVSEGEADPKNAAYLYDRVMLKISGKQRYGTQLECKSDGLQPQPLEDPKRVDELRRAVNLPPLAEYIRAFPSTTCHRPRSTTRG
jgi:hypothetical protein